MPRRTDLKHVLVIGSGPIVIGQACEFDYSGTQACRVLQEEGLRVSLVNSNPATIMTDPEFADATYVEPITAEFLEKVIAKEALNGLEPRDVDRGYRWEQGFTLEMYMHEDSQKARDAFVETGTTAKF